MFLKRLVHRTQTIAVLLFVLSILIRWSLVSQGGQFYFPDETRYNRGVYLYQALRAGDFEQVRYISMFPDHMVFSWVCAGLTAVHHGVAALAGKGDWTAHPEHIASTIWLGAAALSVFSALNVALVYKIAQKLGATDREALWAMLLMSVGQATSYHSRHLVPYECSLFVALLAWYIGSSTTARWRIFSAGLLAGLSYGIYNGYWFLVPVIWLALVASIASSSRRVAMAIAASFGALIGVAAPMIYGWLVGGRQYFEMMSGFSRSVTQGSFAEGWSLPWEYLWHTEGVAGAGVVVTIVAAIAIGRASGRLDFRVRLLVVMLLVSYGLLVLLSNGLHVFVVYARTVKPLMPLLCLLGGWAIARLLAARLALQIATVCALIVHGTLQFTENFYRVFPREVGAAVMARWGNPHRAVSLEGPRVDPSALPVSRPDLVLVNAQALYPIIADRGYPPGQILLRVPHPLQSPVFQYDAYDPKERAVLRSSDVSIKLIALPAVSKGEPGEK